MKESTPKKLGIMKEYYKSYFEEADKTVKKIIDMFEVSDNERNFLGNFVEKFKNLIIKNKKIIKTIIALYRTSPLGALYIDIYIMIINNCWNLYNIIDNDRLLDHMQNKLKNKYNIFYDQTFCADQKNQKRNVFRRLYLFWTKRELVDTILCLYFDNQGDELNKVVLDNISNQKQATIELTACCQALGLDLSDFLTRNIKKEIEEFNISYPTKSSLRIAIIMPPRSIVVLLAFVLLFSVFGEVDIFTFIYLLVVCGFGFYFICLRMQKPKNKVQKWIGDGASLLLGLFSFVFFIYEVFFLCERMIL